LRFTSILNVIISLHVYIFIFQTIKDKNPHPKSGIKMKPSFETKPETLDDLIFEDRNKKYGAYLLRSSYDATIKKSFAISFSLVITAILLSSLAFRNVKISDPVVTVEDKTVFVCPMYTQIPEGEAHASPAKASSSLFKPVDDKKPVNEYDQTVTSIEGIRDAILTGIGVPSGVGVDGDHGLTSVDTISKGTRPSSDILLIADEMPEFPGGNDALTSYIIHNFRVPGNIDGQVKIKVFFIVDELGKISGVKAMESENTALANEAERVVKNMPSFKPGKMHGTPVKVQYYLPIRILSGN
jgi:protein TonB